MTKPTAPTKEQVRDWLIHRQADPQPLPELKQIRRELGWDLPDLHRAGA
jgi:hypothetical protein